jgi:hypothetical protein
MPLDFFFKLGSCYNFSTYSLCILGKYSVYFGFLIFNFNFLLFGSTGYQLRALSFLGPPPPPVLFAVAILHLGSFIYDQASQDLDPPFYVSCVTGNTGACHQTQIYWLRIGLL